MGRTPNKMQVKGKQAIDFCNRSAKMVIKTTFINEYKNNNMGRSSLPNTPKYGTFESPKHS